MTRESEPKKPKTGPRPGAGKQAREARSAAALRANLKRRKDQLKARAAAKTGE